MRKSTFFTGDRDPKSLSVQEVMEDAVVTANPEANALDIAQLLVDQGVGSVPVVEADRTLVGLISDFDILRVMDEGKDLRSLTAKDILTRDVVSVAEHMLVTEVIRMMRQQQLIRMPVLRGKTLVGLVAREDLLFGYIRATVPRA